MLKTIPYRFYQVDAIESWLDEQAQKGLFLRRILPFGQASFRKGAPQPLRYRVDVKRGIGYTGEQERIAAYQEMGWDYVWDLTPYMDIYCCGDPSAPELNTDEETLHQVLDRRLTSELRWSVAAIVLVPLLIGMELRTIFRQCDGFYASLLDGYALLVLCWLLLGVALLINSISCAADAGTTRRRLLLTRDYHTPAQVRKRLSLYRVSMLLWAGAVLLLLCLSLFLRFDRSRDFPVRDFPAPTVSELFPGAQSRNSWAADAPQLLCQYLYLRQGGDSWYYDVDVRRIGGTWLAERYAQEQAQRRALREVAVPGWDRAWYSEDDPLWGGQFLLLQDGAEVWTVLCDRPESLLSASDRFAR